VDGLLQARPVSLARSVLVVDALHPFGAWRCPPLGDLKAPVDAFAAITDDVVLVADPATASIEAASRLLAAQGLAPSYVAFVTNLSCSNETGDAIPLGTIRRLRLGLALTLARPDRVIASLRARNVVPACLWKGLDHHGPSFRDVRDLQDLARRNRLDAWLTTTKCATLLEGKPVGVPLWSLSLSTRLDPQPPPVLDSPTCERRKFSVV
jgi:tetraacyldisaccharide-1-P 4'-kinase